MSRTPPPTPWLRPVWAAPAPVQAMCSTRAGGVSTAPYDSLNLGDHVGDDPARVAQNRHRYASAMQARPVFLRQVHGIHTVHLDGTSADGIEADACVTTTRGIACTIMVADCLPVLFASERVVGAAHAGWRGLAGHEGAGVLESLWRAFWPHVGARDEREAAARTHAWLGPCIGPDAFEVGTEVRDAFVAKDPAAASCFRPAAAAGKWWADLPALARLRLQALGLSSIGGNDGAPAWCTVTEASRFFSHRRDRLSGRFAASVWLG